MNNSDVLQLLRNLDACTEAYTWAEEHGGTFAELWHDCQRGDWLAWLVASLEGQHGITRQAIVLASCECAELVLPLFERKYPKDARPRKAIEAARGWAAGDVDIETVREAARNAAHASAYASAYDAYDAAYAGVDAGVDAYYAYASAYAAYAAYAAASAYYASYYASYAGVDAAYYSACCVANLVASSYSSSYAMVEMQATCADIFRKHFVLDL